MRQRIRTLATVLPVLAGLAAAPGVTGAEPEAAKVTASEPVGPIVILDREVNAMLLPQLRPSQAARSTTRPPKPSTLLQLDAQVTEETDVLFRIQAKQKQFLFLEFRF